MANPLRDMSVIMQGLVAAAIAVVLVLLGIYLPFSPVAQEKDQVEKAASQRTALTQEVQQLQVYKQRYGELKQQMDAYSKQRRQGNRRIYPLAAGSGQPVQRADSPA